MVIAIHRILKKDLEHLFESIVAKLSNKPSVRGLTYDSGHDRITYKNNDNINYILLFLSPGLLERSTYLGYDYYDCEGSIVTRFRSTGAKPIDICEMLGIERDNFTLFNDKIEREEQQMKVEHEIYALSCNSIRALVRSRIKGYSRVEEHNDTLHIYIDNDGFVFNYELHDYLSVILCNDMSNSDIVDDVERKFKSALMKKYFFSN